MAWIYLAELEGSHSPWNPGSDQSPIVKTTDTLNPFCWLEWLTAYWLMHRFGMTYKLSGERCYPRLMWSTADSLARTSALQDAERVWAESEVDYFSRSCALSMKYSRRSSSWKMSQLSLLEDLQRSPQKLPKDAMIVDGALYPLRKLELRTSEKDGGYWPTPVARDYKDGPGQKDRGKRDDSKLAIRVYREDSTGQLNPTWVEWLMGYPEGWTELKDWAMQWFRNKQEKRLES